VAADGSEIFLGLRKNLLALEIYGAAEDRALSKPRLMSSVFPQFVSGWGE
jgi:hypothetical protein